MLLLRKYRNVESTIPAPYPVRGKLQPGIQLYHPTLDSESRITYGTSQVRNGCFTSTLLTTVKLVLYL